jgi:glycosyltransferase involved in cell wall biosynthesis
MGLGHDFDTVLAAAQQMGGDAAHWLFVGNGPRRAAVAEGLRAAGAPATFLPYLPRAELADGLSAADVALVTLGADMAGLIAPSKLYALLAAGVPIAYVGPDEGRTAELIREEGVGVRVANGDGAGLSAALGRLRDDPAERARMGERARALYLERFSRAQALARHVALVEELARPC